MSVSQRSFVSVLAGTSLAATLVATACKRDEEPKVGGYSQGTPNYGGQTGQAPTGYPQGGGAGGQWPSATPGAGQLGTTPGPAPTVGTPGPFPGGGTGGAGGTVPPGTGAGGKATALDPGAAAVIQPIMNELAKAHTVAGAKPLGSVLAGNFQTGQTLEAQIQLQPQKCYTVVASALPPVSELNLQLVAATPLPNLAPVLAADSETGPTAVIGKKPNCYKWAFPLPTAARLVVQVSGGSGLAAAQIYEK